MRRRIGAIALATVAAASTVSAQAVRARADGTAMRESVAALASPGMEGRRTLTPGYDRAADWAAARLREWKLKPAGDAGTYFQAVPIPAPRSEFYWTTGMPALVVSGRAFSFREGDFTIDPASSGGVDVTAEAVFAGYGISAPARGLDEYAGIDVAGKIVVVLRGSPRDAPPDESDFPPDPPKATGLDEPWTRESTDAAKALTAYRKGAAAIVLCDPGAAPRPDGAPAAPPSEAGAYTRPFVVAVAGDAHLLRAFLMRDPAESLIGFTDRLGRIRRAIRARTPQSEATGIRARVKGYDAVTPVGQRLGNTTSRNVLAMVEGTDPVLRNQFVVIGAHLDHRGFRGGLVQPGADDNGSGVAVVLEVARQFAASSLKPRRSVVFALWCGEENGHHGSRRFVSSPPPGIAADRLFAYVNMDMVGLGTGFDVMGAKDFPALFSVVMRNQLPDVARAARPDVSGPGGSDYAEFLAAGVETIALFSSGGGGHPDYHDSGDVAGKVQTEMLATVGQFVLQGAFNLAVDTQSGLPSPDRRVVCDSVKFALPDLAPGAAGAWRVVPAATPADLGALLARTVNELRDGRGTPNAEPATSFERLEVGVSAASLGGDLALLEAARAAFDAGRVDIPGEDGPWVRGGLTEAGKAALASIQEAGVLVNLVRPSTPLLDSVAATTTRPFLVTGLADLDAAAASRLGARDAVIAFECRAGDVAGCAAGLGRLRAAFGDAGHLLAWMSGAANRVETARALYRALAAAGWSKAEIYAVAGLAPGGEAGGNLARFVAR